MCTKLSRLMMDNCSYVYFIFPYLYSLYFQKARFSPLLYCQSQELPNGSVKEVPAPVPALLEATSPDTTEDAGDHKPKLCRLIKVDNSYGFHLNAIQGQPGSFVKEVW